MKKKIVVGLATGLFLLGMTFFSSHVFAGCIGYSGPGGGLSTGPGNNWRRVPGTNHGWKNQ